MTDLSINDDSYDWHLIDVEKNLQCRQLPCDVYQLKNETHFVTLDKEAFEMWRARKITTAELWEHAYPLETYQ